MTSQTDHYFAVVIDLSRVLTPPFESALFLFPSNHVEGPTPCVGFSGTLRQSILTGGYKQRAKHAVFWSSIDFATTLL